MRAENETLLKTHIIRIIPVLPLQAQAWCDDTRDARDGSIARAAMLLYDAPCKAEHRPDWSKLTADAYEFRTYLWSSKTVSPTRNSTRQHMKLALVYRLQYLQVTATSDEAFFANVNTSPFPAPTGWGRKLPGNKNGGHLESISGAYKHKKCNQIKS